MSVSMQVPAQHCPKGQQPLPPSPATAVAGEYVTFRLGAEQYALDILNVHEIRHYAPVTGFPNTPAFIKGVINLRGLIVPIVDLRLKFNLPVVRDDARVVVIILAIARRIVGIVVDSVSDVLTLTEQDIKPAPEFATSLNTQYIRGLGTVDDQMLIVLDIEQLMTAADMALVAESTH